MHVILFVPDLVVTENIVIFGTHLYLLLASSVANCHGYWDMVLTVIVRCRTLDGWLFKCYSAEKDWVQGHTAVGIFFSPVCTRNIMSSWKSMFWMVALL